MTALTTSRSDTDSHETENMTNHTPVHTLDAPHTPQPEPSLHDTVLTVCEKVPPLWSLRDYVAVNPFLGYAGGSLDEAARAMQSGLDASALPELSHYRARWAAGSFAGEDLADAASRHNLDAVAFAEILDGKKPIPTRGAEIFRTFAERHDSVYGTHWHTLLVRSHSRWCSAFVSGDAPGTNTAWAMPAEERLGLFHGWLEAEAIDRSLEIDGLRGWRTWIAALPDDPELAIETALAKLDLPADRVEPYLYRLLGGVYGWASYFRRDPWAQQAVHGGTASAGNVGELLAIRVCSDAAIADLAGHDDNRAVATQTVEDETARLALQDAAERGYARQLVGSLRPAQTQPTRPSAQALFCIDVRSEVLRRHLEAADDTIETRGFAGFFGVSVAVEETDGSSSARCPVLIPPAISANLESDTSDNTQKLAKPLQLGPASTFSFVELLGLTYAGKMAGDAAKHSHSCAAADSEMHACPDVHQHDGQPLPLGTRVTAAATILKFTGLAACGENLARLVVLCGHGGHSVNNAHQAGLECGACGGHAGGLNARIAVGLLNDPEVRVKLAEQGEGLPEDSVFVAGLHDTTTETVTLLDRDTIPASHTRDVENLERSLRCAESETRAERAPTLGVDDAPRSALSRLLRKRSRDWSETRPEWALARNAAFIAARRSRTQGVDLAGRSFLHEYDQAADPDASVLTLILSAPMVVASWINLQYFASTVDNDVLGAGDKALHNRVGSIGVVLGNGGDLRTGLAKQSVHAADGSWFHEPLRLTVVVEADRDRIDAIIAGQPHVADLVNHSWVKLYALDRDSPRTWRRTADGWKNFPAAS